MVLQFAAVGTAVAVLDAGAQREGTTVEDLHDGCGCVRAHDHTICTQVAANRILHPQPPRQVAGITTRVPPTSRFRGNPVLRRVPAAPRSRAPPRA